ncbi:bifunctional phosphoribosyl-AMP cyclohydrolase/phosphoribosyl-ATP diphosphatase HisIE [Effusibacillus dendaii]|uniref:Histidine biosynthesis bifunctional protein HisIE n=1 Tax=Effusibacillus dendaii TaxID=2743772 RepID=A0A7I8DG49_9BACL|nr:bifunctional phosphoribosyl-AMP cyclohydrolase/phosphoribosyl-ATP diphosphatase HisIE [Effusibacillus dendaii]BCJ87939.1 histidine biosynthesis bifunctional protein HisIE [Effusibacillus dendaii]
MNQQPATKRITGPIDWIDQLKYDERGLIPAVVQDAAGKEVLMVAYMNRESLQKTIETGFTWFWSRSRNELWNKGATSGHVQQVKNISYDCDRDTILVMVEQTGVACHTGAYSCFFEEAPLSPANAQSLTNRAADVSTGGDAADGETGANGLPLNFAVLQELIETIDRRYSERPEGAYTTYLFEKGLDKILKKIGEESTEVVVAGKNQDAAELVAETGDLIYHLLVLLKQQSIPFQAVLAELQRRHGSKDIPNKTK